MRKMFLTGLLITVAVFTVYSQTGIIRELTGEVELRPAGASSFAVARAGSQVAQDTIVSTGFRSTAIIEVGSTTITVRPLTRLSLAEISSSAGAETLNVDLQAGRVRVEVKPPAGTRASTTIQSPSATASVRGTILDMDIKNINVVEGSVGFQGTNGLSVVVSQGNSSTIIPGAGAQNPVDIATSNLMPPAPVGRGVSGETVAPLAPAAAGDVGIDLDWTGGSGSIDGGITLVW